MSQLEQNDELIEYEIRERITPDMHRVLNHMIDNNALVNLLRRPNMSDPEERPLYDPAEDAAHSRDEGQSSYSPLRFDSDPPRRDMSRVPIPTIPPMNDEPLLSYDTQCRIAREGVIGRPVRSRWTTREGVEMAICEMETLHIINAIRHMFSTYRRPAREGSYSLLLTELNRRNDARGRGLNIEPLHSPSASPSPAIPPPQVQTHPEAPVRYNYSDPWDRDEDGEERT